jgi:hypothetical protein
MSGLRSGRPSSSLSRWWACSQRLVVVRLIVFVLARSAALADQPGLFAWHVLHLSWMRCGDPSAFRTRLAAKEASQRSLGFLTPADASPLRLGEHGFRGCGKLVGNRAPAGAPAPRNWKHELDVARIDFLLLGNPDCPLQAARIEPLAERARTRVRADGPACVFCSAPRVHLWGTPRSEHFLRPLWVDIEVGER